MIRVGQTSAEFSVSSERLFTSILRRIAPDTADALQDGIEQLEREARRQWPVRKIGRTETDDELLALKEQQDQLRLKGYSARRAKAAARDMLRRGRLDVPRLSEAERAQQRETISKGSIDKFRTSIRIVGTGEVEASITNTAPYAWAIRMGVDSTTAGGAPIFMPLGRRVANELLWKPAKRQADKVAEVVADELVHNMRKV
jgi:hypothetical protein